MTCKTPGDSNTEPILSIFKSRPGAANKLTKSCQIQRFVRQNWQQILQIIITPSSVNMDLKNDFIISLA